jgi:beta-mannanase
MYRFAPLGRVKTAIICADTSVRLWRTPSETEGRMRTRTRAFGAVIAAASAAAGLSLATALPAAAAMSTATQATPTGTAPAATLGIWTSAEDSGNYSTVASQHPNIANYYLAWGQEWPAQFIDAAEAAGATPYIEFEPWNAGPNWNETPSMVDIGDNTSSDCGPDGTSSCQAWLDSIGQAVKSFGHPVIFTFAHEFNVAGQYPWAETDSEHTTPAQWIKAWDTVQADVDNSGASQLAWWMWAPGADTGCQPGCSLYPFTPYWPGAAHVNMVGLDGYPNTQFNQDTFQETFGHAFAEMKTLTNLPVFISETDLAPETGTGGTQTVTQFVQSALADGATGILQFQDGTAPLSSQQWSELDAALASAHGNVLLAAPAGLKAAVSGSHVTLSWNSVAGATGYQVQITEPNDKVNNSKVPAAHALFTAASVKGTYRYKIRAYDRNGSGRWSGTKSFTVTS